MWKNTYKFREEAIFFQEYGYYNCGVYGTQEYRNWWIEQRRRCKEGYVVDDQRITGDHYFYLNFTQIKLTKEENDEALIVKDFSLSGNYFPDFWDGDAEYFKAIELCELKGKHLIVGKGRRKGYSYKNSSLAVNRCLLYFKYQVSLASYVKEYLLGEGALFDLVYENINFINEHTAWNRQALKDSPAIGKYVWGYEEWGNGIKVTKGYKSSITSYGQLGKNPDALRGKRRELVLFEECGAFPNLLQAIKPVIDTLKQGTKVIGLMILFGTGGGAASNWADFEEIFYNPESWGFMAFDNKWEPDSPFTKCGFFHPHQLNLQGHDEEGNSFMDKDGNSFIDRAVVYEKKVREELLDNPNALQSRQMENPLNPSEAFLKSSFNDFPIVDLSKHLQHLKAGNKYEKLAFIGDLYYDEKRNVAWKPNKKKKPIIKYPIRKTEDKTGCVVIWEMPFKNEFSEVPEGMYEAGLDPYSQDQANSSVSLGSLFIRKKNNDFNNLGDYLVAEYSGRPETVDDYYNQVILLLEFYGCKVMAENMFRDFFTYLKQKDKGHLLADSPTDVINSHIKKTSVKRGHGTHMTKELRLAGLRYIKKWLLRPIDYKEDGSPIYNLTTIKSIPLLQELISFDVTVGNFDRIDALIQLMFFGEQTYRNEVKEFKPKDKFFNINLGKKKKQLTKFR